MYKTLTIQNALALQNSVFIDVRSPLEFDEAAIPGAINVPLLSDEERVVIGTLYKQEGAKKAREEGLRTVSPKFPKIFDKIKSASQSRFPIIYCWRGGLRSQTTATVMSLAGLEVAVIDGGYKSFRQEVLRVLNSSLPFELVTLYGLTGAGKTELLQQMKQDGLPVIDLEGLASHRGSAFGQLGIPYRQTQKRFETLLYSEIQKYKDAKIVFIEGESRRIGPVLLTPAWMESMSSGKKVFTRSSLEARTQRIMKEYFKPQSMSDPVYVDTFKGALSSIQRRLGGKLYTEVSELFEARHYEDVTRLLLERYYDKNYKFSSTADQDEFDVVISHDHSGQYQDIVSRLYKVEEKKPCLGRVRKGFLNPNS